ncbi:MAG TPA: AIR synthase related protein, partial [Gemmatimonadaceae bacterium]|nr:AIR synthase related protein [Gemmatimonadaceae bacterium]
PTYTPDAVESIDVAELRRRDVSAIAALPEERDPAWTLERLLSSPTIASKTWVYRQYDTTVRTNTVIGPGGDAAVVRVRGTDRALALKTDCNSRYVYLDPRLGAQIAVCEAARNVACAGGRPMAVTNNLNFGNPRRPEVYYQLREAVRGMGEACEALGTPVTGGNVSLYNENPNGAVYPTPVIGMVGLIESLMHVTPSAFQAERDAIVLLGEPTGELGASEYLARIHGVVAGAPPACDLARERALVDALLEAIAGGVVRSAHDCSDGGLAVALAECCVMDRRAPHGARVDLTAWRTLPARAVLFGEAQGRIVVSSPSPDTVVAIAKTHGIAARVIGHVGGPDAPLHITTEDAVLEASLARLDDAYHEAIPRAMARAVASQ